MYRAVRQRQRLRKIDEQLQHLVRRRDRIILFQTHTEYNGQHYHSQDERRQFQDTINKLVRERIFLLDSITAVEMHHPQPQRGAEGEKQVSISNTQKLPA
eukprot:TRINITY_DN6125_c0_g1_i1.p1 TRINITY_DN6125_c0_g1~~TRINITY_DN6125_c0_g1_i1.p1  ORF type:complete len:100 (-),score=24.08 TRINITY_DN6125_c0_g1_i1:26-325(-)